MMAVEDFMYFSIGCFNNKHEFSLFTADLARTGMLK